MWKMLDSDFECGDECGGPGPPPEFLIPPPPRPPFLNEIIKCDDNSLQFNNGEICEAIPILDASYHSSPSLQTSALIILCSVILVLVILISSLLVWKHKRKVQNFLPCKTPTRGHPLDTSGVSGHSVTYEDPDVHLGHRPLVLRHHHNIEMIHPKAIHFPSGYPMTSSPPLFVCSSPGPDPYRSHDNVYEELGPPRDSDIESEPPLNSDDDFAEDELSLPGERSFQKITNSNTPNSNNGNCSNSINNNNNNCDNISNSNNISTICNNSKNSVASDAATIIPCSGENTLLERQLNERNSLLNNNNSISNNSNSNNNNGSITLNSPIIFRNRKIYQQNDDHNTKTSSLKNNRDRIMTLPYRSNLLSNNISNNDSSNNDNNNVSTIYRDHPNDRLLMLPPAPPISQNVYTNSNTNNNNNNTTRSLRAINHSNTNNNRIYFDRSLSNRLNYNHDEYLLEPNYDYTEPIYHHHDSSGVLRLNAPISNNNNLYNHHSHTHSHHHNHHPYILPEFTTFRSLNSHPMIHQSVQQHSPNAMIYSRDSSFGSDSGYSQHTQASSNRNGGNSNNNNNNVMNSSNNNKNSSSDRSFGGSLIGATFGWGKQRSKDKSNKNTTFDGS